MLFLYLCILLNEMVEMLSIDKNDGVGKWKYEKTRGRKLYETCKSLFTGNVWHVLHCTFINVEWKMTILLIEKRGMLETKNLKNVPDE